MNKKTQKKNRNPERKFYFLIKSNGLSGLSDLLADSGYSIKNELLKRGNWEEFNIKSPQIKNPDFIYTQGKQLYDRSLFKYHPKIKNNIEGLKNFSNKYNFSEELKKINPNEKKKYILNHYYINLYDYKNDDDISSIKTINYFKSIFNKNKVLICKALYSGKGEDVFVFDNFDDFYSFFKKYYYNSKSFMEKHSFEKYKQLPDFDKYYNIEVPKTEWVLQEYINNPLLIQNRKFHFRVTLIYFIKKNKKPIMYLYNNFIVLTAKSEYKQNDYLNKDIHDSHYRDSIKGLSFKNDLPKENNKNRHTYVLNQVIKISKDISQYLLNNKNYYKCYDQIENCYQFFGLDLMVNDKYDVKLIELNHVPGFPWSNYAPDLFSNLISHIVDPILPPKNKINDENVFIQL